MRFRLSKTFTTSLSSVEGLRAVRTILNSRPEGVFSLDTVYSGSIDGNEFSVGERKGMLIGILSPGIKGTIESGSPTRVALHWALPWLLVVIYSIFPCVFVVIAFLPGEMTINGVERVPEIYERILFALAGIAIPGIIFFFNCILPIWNIESRLKRELNLVEIREEKPEEKHEVSRYAR